MITPASIHSPRSTPLTAAAATSTMISTSRNWSARICSRLGPEPVTRRSVMNWDELRELARRGVCLGGHTRNHKIMTTIPPDEQRREVERCRQDLEREIGKAPPVFCYPNGSHDVSVVEAARAAGVRLAFTTLDGHNDLRRADPLRLRRTNLTPRTAGIVFRARLRGWAAHLDAWRHRRSRRVSPAPGRAGAP